MITQDAEQGQLTVIERNGTKLVLIPAAKLFEIAEQSRRERTVGDILDAYPGVLDSIHSTREHSRRPSATA